MSNTNAITIQGVRLSYCALFQPKPPFNNPNGDAKYSVTVLVPKSNTRAKAMIDGAINAAIERGVANPKCWKSVRPPAPAIPVHDGDGVRPNDGSEYGPECKNCWVFTASSKQAPFVVDAQVQPIINAVDVYSGMWGNVNVEFYAYNNTKKGIGCALNGVQKVRDGEPLGATRVTADEAFQPVSPDAAGYGAPDYGAAPPQRNYGYPQQQNNGYAPQQGYPQQNNGYAAQNNGYAPQQGYPQQGNNGYTPQNNGYAPQQGYPQQGNNDYFSSGAWEVNPNSGEVMGF